MVKPILQLYPVIPAASEAEREAMRPLGRNVERYNETVHGMTELIKAADRLDFWGASCIEHHFHSEGYEVGPSPGILNAYWASFAKQVRIGQLGFTMGAQDPLRVAEDTAMLDHLTRGRSFVGFSRGYQSRWTNVLGQHLGSKATLSPTGKTDEEQAAMESEALAKQLSDDKANREIFEESVGLVIDAWTQDSIEHNSERWQIPFPHGAGVEWGMNEATKRLGAPGEIGPDGTVKRISVCPAPYTDPHPPVFVASNASLETVEYCGARGFIPTYFSPSGRAETFGRAYVDVAKEAGRDYEFGENQAVVRWMQIGDTTEDARQAVADYDLEIYRNLYKPLTPMIPLDDSDPIQSVLDCGLWIGGDIDEVRDQFVKQWEVLPAEYCVLIFHYAQQPLESVIKNLELFVEHIKPALDELTYYSGVAA